ncbi:hypothetical protein SAMN04487905_1032 [Actinopolyspora xinjiangensis]|uniref:Uncharacterized protein n=1 Tax=Actinopolyspora xinjiangensis TaxID=405564 RepID=A0A1H0RC40_9ACTN|nr:hypothetical protein SAMN04487905_1032 [Actinopolyspora xinjiangensis]
MSVLLLRRSRATPTSRSSARIEVDRACWDKCRRAAARVKLPSSATVMRWSSLCRSSPMSSSVIGVVTCGAAVGVSVPDQGNNGSVRWINPNRVVILLARFTPSWWGMFVVG